MICLNIIYSFLIKNNFFYEKKFLRITSEKKINYSNMTHIFHFCLNPEPYKVGYFSQTTPVTKTITFCNPDP